MIITAADQSTRGLSFVSRNFRHVDGNTYESYGHLMQDSLNVRVQASLSPLATVSTGSFTPGAPVPTEIEGVLQTQFAYEDDATARVHIQLRSNVSWTTNVANRRVTLRISPGVVLAALHPNDVTTDVTCPNRAGGICAISVALHQRWLGPRARDDGVVQISCGFSDDPSSAIAVGNMSVVPTLPLADQREAVYVELPTRALYRNEEISVLVKSLFTRFVDTFEITIDVGDGIQILNGVSFSSNGRPVFNGAFSVNSNSVSASGSFNRYIVSKKQTLGSI